MNRRDIFNFIKVGAATAAVSSLPLSLLANEGIQLILSAEISFNHGHSIPEVSTDKLIIETRALRSSVDQGANFKLSIQGKSGHPHDVLLTREDLESILFEGELQTVSTLDAGHQHDVIIKLESIG